PSRAFSNGTVYTARYAFPSCDSTSSSTPGAEAFPWLRRRRGSTELSDAESVPHVVLDRRWKAQKVALRRPDPMQRLLVGSQNTTHFTIIPVLGYSRKRAVLAHGPGAGRWVDSIGVKSVSEAGQRSASRRRT